ncbi:LamG domain-containing protein [Patescibacteria group bacterium]|nr:LamG domain-containing protein [Patescibacteria group bacterium]MBU1877206.1 LamG domain-containing protein [Patescibacteria group bacterium]
MDIGTGPTSAKNISFWAYPETTTEYLVDLNGTAHIWLNFGTVTALVSPTPTIYVNGIATTTAVADQWQHIVVTTGTGINVSDLDISRIEGTGYMEGKVDEVRIYNRALSSTEVRYHYNKGGPVAQWKFNEGEGTTAYDSTYNNNDGTITEATLVEGKSGSAVSFDGVDDYVEIADNSSLTLNSAIMVEAWVKPAVDMTLGDYQYRIANKLSYSNNGWYLLYYAPEDTFKFDIYNGNGHSAVYAINPSVNTWYHIVGVSDGTTHQIYVNGVAGTSVTHGTLTNSTLPLQISGLTALYTWNGSIDDVCIHNYARTQAQILQDYNSGFGIYFK